MDAENLQVGVIEEVVVVPETFAVAYVLVETAAAQYQAIPLGAFEVNENGRWKIDLDRESISLDPEQPRYPCPLTAGQVFVGLSR